MGDMHDMSVWSPIVDTEQKMKLTIAVSNIVGMNLIVAGTRSVRPLIVEVEYVDSLVPVCQITADIEVTIGGYTA